MVLFRSVLAALLILSFSAAACGSLIQDGLGRSVTVPDRVDRIICSGSGCLRLAVYLGLDGRVVAVDSMEREGDALDARPYALARPAFRDLPLFGEFRGNDSAELILSLDPGPQVIFKSGCTAEEAEKLSAKTGIPVVAFDFGDLGERREKLYFSLNLMARVAHVPERAREITDFFDRTIEDLASRSRGGAGVSSYVGGIAFRGPHGLLSTEPSYPPFLFLGVKNAAAEGPGARAKHATVSKEALLQWDPDVLFVDLSTVNVPGGGALWEIASDPIWQGLRSVESGRIYGVLPYNWYSQNFGSILADAYFIGSILFPQGFSDTDPRARADEIYEFLVGEPVFQRLDSMFGGMVFSRLRREAAGSHDGR